MAGKEPDIGHTAQTVADNVRRLRESLELNYTELSDRLHSVANWSINAVGIRRIESGARRVTPDDLMALAVALRVSPVALLRPDASSAEARVEATGLRRAISAEQLWDWLCATSLGYYPVEHESPETFFRRTWPQWKQAREEVWLDGIDDIHAGMLEKSRQLLAMREAEAAPHGDD